MNILIVGMGSIGTRHFNVLKNIGNHKIYALKSGKGNNYHKEQQKDIVEIYSLDEIQEKIDRVIISNPTNLHQETLIKCKKFECPIFVEKPIADSINEISQNLSELKNYRHRIMVGYVLRFHPLFEKLKEFIKTSIIGDVVLCNMKVGHYLPSWHKYEDYKNVYYSQKKLGGGAIRTLSHEIDLSLFLFGHPESVMGIVDKVSNLEIDVDDYAFVNLKTKSTIINIEMNFLDPQLIRKGEIYGTKGKLEYDFVLGEIRVLKNSGEVELLYKCPKEEYNVMYEKQMKYFLDDDNNIKKEICDLTDSITVMEIIESAEESNIKKERSNIHE